MNASHTPGPWEVKACNGRLGAEPGLYIQAGGRNLMRGEFCRSEADANLIAAAPNLLAALNRARFALDFLSGCTLLHGEDIAAKFNFEFLCKELAKVEAALAEVQS